MGNGLTNVPLIMGWDFEEDEVLEARKNNRLLMIDAETSKTCNLRCDYCYRDDKLSLEGEMTIEERIDLIDQAKELGVRTFKIVGAGEPLVDVHFWDQIKHISKRGMTSVIFTNGMKLNREDARHLYTLGASIILKYNSRKEAVEDTFVGVPGYTRKRDETLQTLIDVGFNKKNRTRLGIDAVITEKNKDEILDIFQFARDNNIFPLIQSLIPLGKAFGKKELLSKEEIVSVTKQAKEVDEKKYGIKQDAPLPYLGGFVCDQLYYALYINIQGDVYDCPGQINYIGNIRKQTLKELWNSPLMEKIKNTEYISCPARERYWKWISASTNSKNEN